MNISIDIQDGVIYQKIEYNVEYSELIKIVEYLEDMPVFGIKFKSNGVSDVCCENPEFNIKDCEALFSLGILGTSSWAGMLEYSLCEEYEARLIELNRLNAINIITND